MTSSLAAALAGAIAPNKPSQFITGTVVAWSTGDRQVNLFGTNYGIDSYDARLASTLAPGDTVLIISQGGTFCVLCQLAAG